MDRPPDGPYRRCSDLDNRAAETHRNHIDVIDGDPPAEQSPAAVDQHLELPRHGVSGVLHREELEVLGRLERRNAVDRAARVSASVHESKTVLSLEPGGSDVEVANTVDHVVQTHDTRH